MCVCLLVYASTHHVRVVGHVGPGQALAERALILFICIKLDSPHVQVRVDPS